MLSWISFLASIPLIILGAHGLYAYFYTLDAIFGIMLQNQGKLFFVIDVPEQVSGWVTWMTLRGIQSFFIPGIFLVGGIALIWFAFKNGLHFSWPRWNKWSVPHSRSRSVNSRYQNHSSNSGRQPGWQPVIIKTLLSLVTIIGIVLLAWYGYGVFTHQTTPLAGALLFIAGAAILCVLIWFLRTKYIWFRPSFKVIALVIILVVVIFSFAGVEPLQAYKNSVGDTISSWFSSGTKNASSNAKPKTTFRTGNVSWEVVLNSLRWSGQKVSVEVVATNKGSIPADFPYDTVSPLGVAVNFVVVDSYNQWYQPDGSPSFNVQRIYPGESRTFSCSFTVNSRSGNVALFVTRYTGTSQFRLFDLGTPK